MATTLIVLGFYARSRMPLELTPNIDIPYIAVITTYRGAGPEEIETKITKKVEDAVVSVNGIRTVTSASQEGISAVTIEFNIGVSPDTAAADVREKVSAIRASLPTDCDEPVILKFDLNSIPVLYYGVTGKRPSREVRDIADNVIKPRLSKISGVAAITVRGGDVREIGVYVDKPRLDAYGLTIDQLVSLLAANTQNYPVGYVTEGHREYDVRVAGDFRDVDTISRVSFRAPDGRTVHLRDIAKVVDSVEERREGSRIDGSDSVGIVIQKTSEGNTVDIANEVRAEVDRLSHELPKDIKFVLDRDMSVQVKDAVDDVLMSLFIGAALAVLVVYLFLHNVRGTIIVAIAIPTSVISTFLPMFAFGFSLNMMTLLALSLAVGILVDDSIVVLENIYRHLSRGEPPVEAAYNGRSEIGLAAITITAVDVVVYVPIAFMGGIVGQFFKSFGITIASATLFSLLMSFTLTPMLAAHWYRMGEAVEAERGVLGAINRFYHWLDAIYRRALDWGLRYRGLVVYVGSGILVVLFLTIAASVVGKALAPALLPIAILFAVTGLMLMWRNKILALVMSAIGVVSVYVFYGLGIAAGHPLLTFRFAPDLDQGQVSVTGELPSGTSLERTQQVVETVEQISSGIWEVNHMFTTLGATRAGMRGSSDTGPQYFSTSIALRDKVSLLDAMNPFADTRKMRKRSDVQIADELRRKLGTMPGVKLKVAAATGIGPSIAPLEVDLLGDDMGQLTTLANKILAIFERTEGVVNPDISTRMGKPEQRVEIDRDKCAAMGLTVAQVANILRISLLGDDTIVYRERGNEYAIRVRFDDRYRHSIGDLSTIMVGQLAGSDGRLQPIRLGQVANISFGAGPTRIDRRDRQKMVSVTANVERGYASGNIQLDVNRQIEQQGIDFGPVMMKWSGENERMQTEGGYLMVALVLAIILVYLLMAALFENLLYPLVILISLPQALVGALLGLMAAGHALSIVSMIGIIMLVGLVMKNAILLVDYTNTLRARGKSRTEAILESGPTRLRPILMTTIAMIFGMLPTALGLGRAAEFRAPLATPVIGGLILSTLLTLLVIPCFYTYFDDVVQWIGAHWHRRRHA